MAELLKLEKKIEKSFKKFQSHQRIIKIRLDKNAAPKNLKEHDLVLKWDKD